MATYNLSQENNQQNERIIKSICMGAESGAVDARFVTSHLTKVIETQTKKVVEMHNIQCKKLDRMIALLEKIAGE